MRFSGRLIVIASGDPRGTDFDLSRAGLVRIALQMLSPKRRNGESGPGQQHQSGERPPKVGLRFESCCHVPRGSTEEMCQSRKWRTAFPLFWKPSCTQALCPSTGIVRTAEWEKFSEV